MHVGGELMLSVIQIEGALKSRGFVHSVFLLLSIGSIFLKRHRRKGCSITLIIKIKGGVWWFPPNSNKYIK